MPPVADITCGPATQSIAVWKTINGQCGSHYCSNDERLRYSRPLDDRAAQRASEPDADRRRGDHSRTTRSVGRARPALHRLVLRHGLRCDERTTDKQRGSHQGERTCGGPSAAPPRRVRSRARARVTQPPPFAPGARHPESAVVATPIAAAAVTAAARRLAVIPFSILLINSFSPRRSRGPADAPTTANPRRPVPGDRFLGKPDARAVRKKWHAMQRSDGGARYPRGSSRRRLPRAVD